MISAIIFSSTIYSKDISLIIKHQEEALKNKMKLKIVQEKFLVKSNKFEIKAFPVFSLKFNFLMNNNDDILDLEKELNFFIVYSDSDIYYVNNYFFDKNDVEVKYKLKKESLFKDAIAKAENQSDTVFLLYFVGRPVVGYIVKGQMKFVDTELKSYETLQNLIECRFGDLENFREDLRRGEFENQYLGKVTTFNDAKLIYQNYWVNYYTYNIFNPSSLANALIFEIEEFVKITDYQKVELRKELTDVIVEFNLGKKEIGKLSIIELVDYHDTFDTTIKYVLRKVLLNNQYWIFISNEELFCKLNKKAKDIIYSHYKEGLKISGDSIEETIRKEIFNK